MFRITDRACKDTSEMLKTFSRLTGRYRPYPVREVVSAIGRFSFRLRVGKIALWIATLRQPSDLQPRTNPNSYETILPEHTYRERALRCNISIVKPDLSTLWARTRSMTTFGCLCRHPCRRLLDTCADVFVRNARRLRLSCTYFSTWISTDSSHACHCCEKRVVRSRSSGAGCIWDVYTSTISVPVIEPCLLRGMKGGYSLDQYFYCIRTPFIFGYTDRARSSTWRLCIPINQISLRD